MTKEDIINAAFRVWGRNLYRDTSLTKVAACLNVTKPALYRHFADKKALLDAMYIQFFDHYAAFLKSILAEAGRLEGGKGFPAIIRSIIDYYARNEDYFFFSLNQVAEETDPCYNMAEQLTRRGVFLSRMEEFVPSGAGYPSVVGLATITVIFYTALFHKKNYHTGKPREAEIKAFIVNIEEQVRRGLGFDREMVKALDYERLEALSRTDTAGCAGDNGLLKGVAAVVAEVGPWNASMEMVARRSGLSKSGLYAHFRNKQDMLRRLFFTEFERIAGQARKSVGLSDIPEEQLYLGIFSIASYLRSRPEILVAMNWVRTRRLNLGHPPKSGEFQVFREIAIETLRNDENESWIFFLVLGTMMRRFKKTAAPMLRNTSPEEDNFSDLSNRSIRRLYRFVCLGFRDFEG